MLAAALVTSADDRIDFADAVWLFTHL